MRGGMSGISITAWGSLCGCRLGQQRKAEPARPPAPRCHPAPRSQRLSSPRLFGQREVEPVARRVPLLGGQVLLERLRARQRLDARDAPRQPHRRRGRVTGQPFHLPHRLCVGDHGGGSQCVVDAHPGADAQEGEHWGAHKGRECRRGSGARARHPGRDRSTLRKKQT
eukprot:scaffold547_cov99-Isochrysis_galbana.AAC.4